MCDFQSGLYPIAEVVCVLLFNSQPPFWRRVLDCGSPVQSMNPRFLPSTQAPNFSPTVYLLLPDSRAQSLMTPQMGNTIRHGKEISATHNFTLKISLWKCVAESQSWQGNVTQARPFRQWTPWGSTWGPRAWSFPDLGWQLLRPSWKDIPCTTTEVETLGSCGEVCPKVF